MELRRKKISYQFTGKDWDVSKISKETHVNLSVPFSRNRDSLLYLVALSENEMQVMVLKL